MPSDSGSEMIEVGSLSWPKAGISRLLGVLREFGSPDEQAQSKAIRASRGFVQSH